MTDQSPTAPPGWRDRLPAGVRPYTEKAPIAAFFVGVSSGFLMR
jgi:PAT family beta-lactamase induction signal transducer AmpG